MQSLTSQKTPFNSLAHIPIDEPLQKQLCSLKGKTSIQEMDHFYLEMLEQLSPVAQKTRYLAKLAKGIQAIFRVEKVMVAVLYTDATVQCYSQAANDLIDSISDARLTVSRVSYILHSQFADKTSLEYYSADHPTHQDLIKGYLYSKEDIHAGFVADDTTLETLMCDWLQHYQLWMQDYLYFNLAQITKEHDNTTKVMPLKSPLESYNDFEEQEAISLLK